MKDHHVIHRDPALLRIHPKVKHLTGRWSKDSDAAKSLRRSIQQRGIIQPLIITPDDQVMDGVTRMEASRTLQLATVPCIVRPEAEALEICIETELNRRHGTKSQLAFRFAPLITEAFEQRKADNAKMKTLPPAERAGATAKRLEDYAEDLDVSVRMLEQANELHTLFDQFAKETWNWLADGLAEIGRGPDEELTFREYFTAHILLEHKPMGLGGALAGLKQKLSQEGYDKAGRKHGGGKPSEASDQLRLFKEVFGTLDNRFEYWTALDDEQRDDAVKRIAVSMHKAPTDLLEKLSAKIKAELKARTTDH